MTFWSGDVIFRRGTRRRAITACLAALALLLAGCDASPDEYGREAADGTLEQFTGYLDVRVVQAGGGTSQQRFARLRAFLVDPDKYPQYSVAEAGDPTWKVLSTDGTELDIAVWAYGKSSSLIGGNDGGWGHSCARYHVANDRLVSVPRACPGGLSETGVG
jgi:hypothetical protein